MIATHYEQHTFTVPENADLCVCEHKDGKVSLHMADYHDGWGFSVHLNRSRPKHVAAVKEMAIAMGFAVMGIDADSPAAPLEDANALPVRKEVAIE